MGTNKNNNHSFVAISYNYDFLCFISHFDFVQSNNFTKVIFIFDLKFVFKPIVYMT